MTMSRIELENNKYYDNTFKTLGLVLFVFYLEYPVYPVCLYVRNVFVAETSLWLP